MFFVCVFSADNWLLTSWRYARFGIKEASIVHYAQFSKYKTIFKLKTNTQISCNGCYVTAISHGYFNFHRELCTLLFLCSNFQVSTLPFQLSRFYFSSFWISIPTFTLLLFKFLHFHSNFHASAFQVSAFPFQRSRLCFSSFNISILTFTFLLFKFLHFHSNFQVSTFQVSTFRF